MLFQKSIILALERLRRRQAAESGEERDGGVRIAAQVAAAVGSWTDFITQQAGYRHLVPSNPWVATAMLEVERRDSADHVLHGCLTSIVIAALGTTLVSLIFFEWLGWIGVEGQRAVGVGIWLVAICVGGYVAARRSEIAGLRSFRTALWVGVLALLPLLANLPEPHDDALFTEKLMHVLLHPVIHWRHFVIFVFSVPAALLGWVLAQRIKRSH